MKRRSPIAVYHAHVYFDPATRKLAMAVRDGLVATFAVDCRWRDRPIGPHTKANFRVRISRGQFGRVVAWLMLHRSGLSVLVHPYTEDRVADHSDRALWLGRRVAIKFGFLKRPATAAGRRSR
jgi:aromatic ring-cleaving dioxygenase